MDRDEFMELVYDTFADEPDNVLANGIIEAADAYVEHEKAQLTKEDTTPDFPEPTRIISETRAIPSDDDRVSLSEKVTATFYDDEYEEWSQKTVTVRDVLDAVCDEYTVLPSVQPEPAIPLSWIDKYIEWLQSLDTEFANLAAAHISVMVKKWRDEQNERTD